MESESNYEAGNLVGWCRVRYYYNNAAGKVHIISYTRRAFSSPAFFAPSRTLDPGCNLEIVYTRASGVITTAV